MRIWTMLMLLIGPVLTACAGGMGGDLSGNQDTPPACRAGNMQLCQTQLMQQNQQQYGMTPQQQQMMMQQMMQPGMGMPGQPGMMPTGQPGMMPQGQMPMMQPGVAPGMPGQMTPQEEDEFNRKIQQLQQEQQQNTGPRSSTPLAGSIRQMATCLPRPTLTLLTSVLLLMSGADRTCLSARPPMDRSFPSRPFQACGATASRPGWRT